MPLLRPHKWQWSIFRESVLDGHHSDAENRWKMIRTFFLLLILTTLLYSFNLLEWREEEVLAVAVVAVFFLALLLQRYLVIPNRMEIAVVVLFSTLVVGQQYFVADGSTVFGVKYALVLVATFVPYWIAHTLGGTGVPGLERTVASAIGVLLFVTTITLFTSYLFGKGEVHMQPSGHIRAFGWLGDAFSPVIVFLVIYYFFRRLYLIAGLAIVMLLVTGAKSAFLMLILSPLVLLFSAASLRLRVLLAGLYLVLLLGALIFAAPIFESMSDLFQADYSYYTRILSIYSGLDYFFSAPLTGIGVNQSLMFVEVDSRQHADVMGVESHFSVYQIDNAIVRTAAETGVLGLTLLLLLLYALLSSAFRALRVGFQIADTRERAIVVAPSLWVIGFILFYQTTGWFEAGHPQLCWLLLFSMLSSVFYRRCRNPQLRRTTKLTTDRTEPCAG